LLKIGKRQLTFPFAVNSSSHFTYVCMTVTATGLGKWSLLESSLFRETAVIGITHW